MHLPLRAPGQNPVRLAVLAIAATAAVGQQPTALRDLDAGGDYRTPRSGEGVRGRVFGEPRDIQPRDRSSVRAWSLGGMFAPHAEDSEAWPYGSLYFWEHRDDSLLRAVIAGAYNDVLWSPDSTWLFSLTSYTPPWSSSELTDGEVTDAEKVQWGYARLGIGAGCRSRIGKEQDNLAQFAVALEPGALWFGRADDTAAAFALPDSTFEWRAHAYGRRDELERNLLELPHRGIALGADVVYGNRADWDDWGLGGVETHSGSSGRDYVQASAYAFVIGDVPGVGDERWRAHASVHAGLGDSTDRFSAMRVGGGPDLRGEEWDSTARPWLPGSAFGEFFPRHYAVASLGIRRELAFFAWLDVGCTVAALDRDRQRGAAREREDDVLTAVSARLVSGFLGDTRVLLGYAYGFDVVRQGERGGHEVVVQVSARF